MKYKERGRRNEGLGVVLWNVFNFRIQIRFTGVSNILKHEMYSECRFLLFYI